MDRNLTVPVGDVLVGDTGGDIEHDDTALAVDVVSVTETTELLLSCSVPDVKLDLTKVLIGLLALFSSFFLDGVRGVETYGGEGERVDLDTESSDVLLLELSSQVTLDEGGLEIN